MEFSQRRYKSARIIFQSSIIEWTEMRSLINRIDWHDGRISPYLRFPCDSGQSTFPLYPRLFVPQKKVSNLYYGRFCLGLRHSERKFIISFRFNPIHINIATWKKSVHRMTIPNMGVKLLYAACVPSSRPFVIWLCVGLFLPSLRKSNKTCVDGKGYWFEMVRGQGKAKKDFFFS